MKALMQHHVIAHSQMCYTGYLQWLEAKWQAKGSDLLQRPAVVSWCQG